MQNQKGASVSLQEMLIGLLCAAIAAWLALQIYDYLISNYSTARFWETWLDTGGLLYAWVPSLSFAFITGIVIGVVIALLFPQHFSVKIAAVAAVMQLAAGMFSGGAVSGLVTGVGLLMGALPSRIAREPQRARR
jgi:hypothetical protein